MNKFLIFALFLALTNCASKISECDTGIDGQIYLNTNKKYEYKVEFDWTDEDEFDFNVPIVTDATNLEGRIIPFFINTSLINDYSDSDTYKPPFVDDIKDVKKFGYPVFYPFDATISNTEIRAKDKVKSTAVKANENDVTQKFMKYFGIAYCTGPQTARVKYFKEILVIVNNGNYFSTSKILLACLALLFL